MKKYQYSVISRQKRTNRMSKNVSLFVNFSKKQNYCTFLIPLNFALNSLGVDF